MINQYGDTRLFSETIPTLTKDLYRVYLRLDKDCRQDFLNVLLYRASLDVNHIASTRKPMSQMWAPPPSLRTISPFCDVGAYDGDTLISMKAVFPGLTCTVAVEPNADLVAKIEAAAQSNNLKNRIFSGAAWSHKTRLSCNTHPNGMMVLTEDMSGTIEADALDNITDHEQYEYVKLDVEGSEAQALKGARALLRNSVCIAIASYHLPTDLVDIPNEISSALGTEAATEWRLAFHHYSECFDDSIFYFYRETE